MTSELITFRQVVAQAQEGEAAAESETEGFAKRQKLSRPEPVEENYVAPRDRELAVAIIQSIAQLKDAMDGAIRAGLIVEPSFKTIGGRFNEFGVSVDSHICNVQIYRKLA